jgi:hypothetical protein
MATVMPESPMITAVSQGFSERLVAGWQHCRVGCWLAASLRRCCAGHWPRCYCAGHWPRCYCAGHWPRCYCAGHWPRCYCAGHWPRCYCAGIGRVAIARGIGRVAIARVIGRVLVGNTGRADEVSRVRCANSVETSSTSRSSRRRVRGSGLAKSFQPRKTAQESKGVDSWNHDRGGAQTCRRLY